MLTSILSTTVARQNWHWNKYFVFLILVAFLCVDPSSLRTSIENRFRRLVAALAGLVMFTIMTTWKSEHLPSVASYA